MFEVGLIKVGLGTDFMEGSIVVIDATMEAMGIFMSRKKILFNTFRAGACVAEFTNNFFAKNGRVSFGTDGTFLGFDNLIGNTVGFSGHGVRIEYIRNRINFYESMGGPFLPEEGLKRQSVSV